MSTTQLLDFFMLGDRAVAEFSRTGRLNTDDHPRLEFLAPESLRRKQSLMENFAAHSASHVSRSIPIWSVPRPAERALLARWYCRHDLEARRPVVRAGRTVCEGDQGIRPGGESQPAGRARAGALRGGFAERWRTRQVTAFLRQATSDDLPPIEFARRISRSFQLPSLASPTCRARRRSGRGGKTQAAAVIRQLGDRRLDDLVEARQSGAGEEHRKVSW